MSIRADALDIVANMDLTEDELIKVENLLSLKTASIRKVALQIIKKSGKVKESAKRLRDSKNAAKIQAADELDPSREEKAAAEAVDRAHGFGLYRPDVYWEPVPPKVDRQWHPAELVKKYGDKVNSFFVELDKLIEKYKDTEFIQSFGEDSVKRTVTIDSAYGTSGMWFSPITYNPNATDNDSETVLSEIWNDFCDKQNFTVQELIAMIAVTQLSDSSVLNKTEAKFYQVSNVANPIETLTYNGCSVIRPYQNAP